MVNFQIAFEYGINKEYLYPAGSGAGSASYWQSFEILRFSTGQNFTNSLLASFGGTS